MTTALRLRWTTSVAFACGVAAIGLIASPPLMAQAGRAGGQAAANRPVWPPKLAGPAAGEVEILPVNGQVYMLVGAGGNIAVQVGDQGVMMVDTGIASMSDKG